MYPEFEKFADEHFKIGRFNRVEMLNRFILSASDKTRMISSHGNSSAHFSKAFRDFVIIWAYARGLWALDTNRKYFSIIPQKLES